MNFNLPLLQLFTCIIIGVILSTIYLSLLWLTIKYLPKIHHKGLYLFISAALRIFLFLYGLIIFSQHNVARLIWILIGFITTRFIVLGLIKQRKSK